MRVKRQAENSLGRGEGNVGDTQYAGCFEDVVCLANVGVKDDVVGLSHQLMAMRTGSSAPRF